MYMMLLILGASIMPHSDVGGGWEHFKAILESMKKSMPTMATTQAPPLVEESQNLDGMNIMACKFSWKTLLTK